ncbi:DUF6288 domain-containing protein [Sulfuriroseicoccus oceanibius]|uniref:Cadherin domain-containing protein n=1 Tax=Sulfuriroseicoccus oceanibius TaxID=2707525 RepID=A0A6B3LE32_9BACT|nr:PA14 domain-containing protein [Sulfuriroseicoccus oceanibius]QQL45417.1 cadherin domain-containing protein [Sulfuriroseicoccus oceanibius]
MKSLRTFVSVVSAFCLACSGLVQADQSSLGPIGGKFQHQDGTNYLKVERVTSGGPGDLAGLQVGDFIYAVNGEDLGVLSPNSVDGWKGSVIDFSEAIERAESGNGTLPVTVLRPGVGKVDLTIQLNAAGAFGPAYPLGSPKYDVGYQWACEQLHAQVTAAANVGVNYNTGLNGLILLSHPNWNDTTGDKPYRTSIDRLKDAAVTYLNEIIVDPVESTNLDGTPNDGSAEDSDPNDQNHVGVGLENWQISTAAMFLAEYRLKTGDTAVDATLQRAADALANRVQEYEQPPYDAQVGVTKVGLMGHGGVTGDYPHVSYAGINIVNAHALSALAMLKGAGANVDHSQFMNCWQRMKECTNVSGGADDGNVGYAWRQGGYDSTGRTAGAVFGMKNYGGISADDQTFVDRQEDYLLRQWQRFQHCHAYTVGGVVLYQFAMPYMSDREQRFLMENMKYFYQLHRNASGTLDYFGGRENNGGDGYLNLNSVAIINYAMAYAVQSGNLESFPKPNTNRLHADFKAPTLTWPTVDARAGAVNGNSATFNVDITDYVGSVLNAEDYTATWTHVSGPATATFSDAAMASTTVNFPTSGTYRIQLQVEANGYTLTEPIDLEVSTLTPPDGYVMGSANYRVYTNIGGLALSDLTSNAKYPDSPDIATTVTSLEGTHGGDNYGSRIQGYIVPPVTGDYTFHIAGDDASQFKFGSSEATATVICSSSDWTDRYQWNKYGSQTSATQSLTAGVPYFFEVLHKEGGGGDHVAVAWTQPGASTPEVIPGRNLAVPESTGLTIISQPEDQSAAAGGDVTFNVVAEGAGPFLYEWTLNGTSYWPVSSDSSLTLTNIGAGSAGVYRCRVLNPEGTVVSDAATLTVTGVGTLTQGGLWREVYEGIGGGSITDLTTNQAFPKFPSSGGVITEAAAPSEVGGNYGQRWTGWVKPDVTGDYTFYIASDDSSELWLSTDESAENKEKIAYKYGYTSEKNWSGGGVSAAIPLVAGNRYYIEVRHKEGGGADHCAVTWRKPGDPAPTNGVGSIPGQYLEYLTGGVHEAVVELQLNRVLPQAETVRIRPGVGLALECSVNSVLRNSATVAWTQEAGPGTVTFDAPGELATGATFSAEGTYVVRCTVDNGGIPVSQEVSVVVSSEPVQTWQSVSVAEPTAGSGTVNADGSITVVGSGNDIYFREDECHLFSQNLTGDFDVRARLASKSLTTRFGQHAALMARESAASGARHASLSHERDTKVAFQYRTELSGNTTWKSTPASLPPVWLRLVRSGGDPTTGTAGQTFTGYYSTDSGATWSQAYSVTYTNPMPETLMVGFAVSSNGSSLNEAVFDNISGFQLARDFGPEVEAGDALSLGAGDLATLAGTATDDGQPLTPGTVTTTWTQFSGPGDVTFGDAAVVGTTASFSMPGTYELRLLATDGVTTTFDDVTVTVAPDWSTPPTLADVTFSVAEDAAIGAEVGTVSGSDSDIGDTLTYAITAGNAGGAFALDASSGVLTVASALDHETTPSYALTVSVTDADENVTTAAVTVNVTNAYESPTAANDALALQAGSNGGAVNIIDNDAVDGAQSLEMLGFVTTPVAYDAGTTGTPPSPASAAGGGWTQIETEDGNPATGSVTAVASADDNGSGLDAWLVTDNTTAGSQWAQYRKAPSDAEIALGNTNGWMLETKLRFVDDFNAEGSTQVEYGNGSKRFLVFYDLDDNDDLTAKLFGTGGGTYTLTSGGTGTQNFHDIVVLYDPATQTASFVVDGVRFDGGSWSGQGSGAKGVEWGNESSGGQGSAAFHTVKWSYFDMPITLGSGAVVSYNSGEVNFDPNGGYDSLPLGEELVETVRYAITDGAGQVAVGSLNVTITGENPDADADTLNDAWEVVHFGNTGVVVGTDDHDGDGQNTYSEMVFGGNPNAPDAPPVQGRIVDSAGTSVFEFKFRRPKNHSDLGVTYQVQSSTSLLGGDWVDDNTAVASVIDDGSNEWIVIELPVATDQRRFYRVDAVTAP